ncbi:MAG: outer membrane beta-barrel protein [Alphaproteobacteria bacterium]
MANFSFVRGKARHVTLLAAATAILLAAAPAIAQEAPATVTSKARPDYDAAGVRVGSLLFFPSIDLGVKYNDNIYATNTNEQNDVIYSIAPSAVLRSDTANHMFEIGTKADVAYFSDNSDEDFYDWSVFSGGRLDVTRNTSFKAGASYNREHEDRSSPNAAAGTKPTKYDQTGAQLGFNHKFNRFGVELGGDYSNFDYKDSRGIAGAVIDQDYRDRNSYKVEGRALYEIQEGYNAFLKAAYNNQDYNNAAAVIDRGSDGYVVEVGSKIELGELAFADLGVGYLQQNYDRKQFNDISGLSVTADAYWNVTQMDTITAKLHRSVAETTVAGASGTTITSFGLGIDHELMRNVILSAGADYSHSQYEGLTREDDVYGITLGGKYLINRNLSVGAEYKYDDRSSDKAVDEFSRNTFLVNLKAGL